MHTGLIPWLDSTHILESAGPFAVLVVCAIVFAETGLLVGFMLPGDTLLVITGLMSNPESNPAGLGWPVWVTALLIGVAAFLGGEVGYLIGHRVGPKIFERKESGLFSTENVARTNAFFTRYGAWAVILARFVPVVRTFAPVAAGAAHMNYKKYSLYNLIGAVIWGVGLTFFGYFIGYIPPVATFVSSYIDVILLTAVVLSVTPALIHYLLAWRKGRKLKAAEALAPGAEPLTTEAGATTEPLSGEATLTAETALSGEATLTAETALSTENPLAPEASGETEPRA